MSKGQKVVVAIIAVVLIAFFVFDVQRFLSFDAIKAQQQYLQTFVDQNVLLAMLAFFVCYVLLIAFSVPGAALLTLLAGALFGLFKGVILVSFASTIGATLAFLGARFLFKDTVQKKFGEKLNVINRGIEQEGGFYLFSLRLVPAFPFFLINLLMAITPIKTSIFYLVSQLGMLPGTIVYVNAGLQLAQLESPSGILSPTIILSFVLLALFPFIARKILSFLRGVNEPK